MANDFSHEHNLLHNKQATTFCQVFYFRNYILQNTGMNTANEDNFPFNYQWASISQDIPGLWISPKPFADTFFAFGHIFKAKVACDNFYDDSHSSDWSLTVDSGTPKTRCQSDALHRGQPTLPVIASTEKGQAFYMKVL